LKGRYFASYHLDFYTGGRHPDELDDRDGEEHHASELSNAGVAETETIQWNYHKDTLHELDSPSINQDPDDKEGEEHHASELTNSSVAETETIQWNNHKDTLHELDSPSTNQDPDDKEGEEYHASELNNSSLAETETTRRNNPKDAPLELDSPSTNHHTLPAAMPGVETEPRPPEPLLAAAYGDVVLFAKLTMENKEALTVKDKNGWEPIHEAARWGQLQILEILIGSGVNVNQVSNFDRGDSPLRIAMDHLEEGHPVLAFLKLHGGI
jgi:ankyrin repeat protein